MAFINFGDTLRSIGINKDYGISELFGGDKQSLYRSNELGGSNVQGPLVSQILPTNTNYNTSSSQPLIDNSNPFNSKVSANAYKSTPSTGQGVTTGYSKRNAAKSLGISTQELEARAKAAGFDSTEEYMQNYSPEIENIYSEVDKYLDNQQSRLMAGEQDYYNTFTSPYESQMPLVNQAKESGIANLQNQQGVAMSQEQDALSAASRLYNELMSRNQQAFGGGANSSVGQAANEIASREAQRQFGSIKNNSAQVVQGIITKMNEVESQAQAMMQQLEMQKEAALSQAKLAFQDKLDAIDADRAQLGQAKAQLKYQAMLELRARNQAIQDRQTEYAMQIEMMREQARLEAGNYAQQIQAQGDAYLGQAQEGNYNLSNANQGSMNSLQGSSSITGAGGNASSNILSPGGYFNWQATQANNRLADYLQGR